MVDVEALLSLLKTFGAPAVFLGLVIFGYLIPKNIYAREVARADSYEAIAKNALETMAKLVQATEAMITIPGAISLRFRSWADFWDAWTHRLNPRYRQSMATLHELEGRMAECREAVDSLLR